MSVRLDTLRSRRIAAGLSITRLAQLANVSDLTITTLENKGANGQDKGGTCDEYVAVRLANAIAPPVAITSSSVASPSVITTAANLFVTGDTVTIASHTSVTPDINGDNVVTVTAGTTFTVPVDVSDDGVGGTASLSLTSLGIARL